ncbi:MAG: dihydroorotase [Chloroflexi bacterium]|nr:dihydroorotase [Chloroflexota bacterium]
MTNPTNSILIRNARILDPSQGLDRAGDLLIVDGRISKLAAAIRDGSLPPGTQVVDGAGLVACPGFIDLHVHLREPGYEDHETIATGGQAAARGGFTTVCAMPNTRPAMDNASVVDYVLRRAREANLVRVLPIGCVTKERAGQQLAEMWELAQAGAIGFSDDGNPVASPHLMRQALTYARGLGLPIINHCEDLALSKGAPVNEGRISNRLGLAGCPAVAEETMVARDIELASLTGGRLHLAHISTAGAVELVRRAKERGLPVTAEATPHHLTLTEEWVQGHDASGPLSGPLSLGSYDTSAKVNPPLRTRADAEALLAGLRDGVIDAIATDHAPHAVTVKLVSFDDAAFGIPGLETAFGSLMGLVHRGELPLDTLVARMTQGPLKLLGECGKGLGSLREGSPADVVLFNPDQEWVVRGAEFASKGKLTPLEGVTLKGRGVATIAGGRVVFSEVAGLAAADDS